MIVARQGGLPNTATAAVMVLAGPIVSLFASGADAGVLAGDSRPSQRTTTLMAYTRIQRGSGAIRVAYSDDNSSQFTQAQQSLKTKNTKNRALSAAVTVQPRVFTP